jgi:hypothetical protein
MMVPDDEYPAHRPARQPAEADAGGPTLEALVRNTSERPGRSHAPHDVTDRRQDRPVRLGAAAGDETDHRASVISITKAGEATLDAARHDRTARLAASLALLEPEDAAALLAAMPALESLADHIAGKPHE